jgi:cell division control protein 45
MYILADQMNKVNKAFFWLWVLGLTDQYLHSRISQAQYEGALTECSKHHFKVNHSKPGDEEEEDQIEESKYDSKGLFYGRVDLETDMMPVGDVKHNMEFRFMLLRKWTLERAMSCSNYVSTKLKLWSEPGRRELKQIMALIGIPASECEQQYRFMAPKCKE